MALSWLILGAGGHRRSVADAIAANGDLVMGFLDDGLPVGSLVNGISVLGASKEHGWADGVFLMLAAILVANVL